MQQAEQKLAALWQDVDAHLTGEAKAFVMAFSPRPDEVQCTPDWVDPVKPDAGSEIERDHEPFEKDFALLSLNSHRKSLPLDDRHESPSVPKIKFKIRGIAAKDESNVGDAAETPASVTAELSTPQEHIVVTWRAMQEFEFLFPSPAQSTATGRSGELPWAEFLHAMTSAGFTADKLFGSAWQFTPTGSQWGIQFHEPHPVSKISFWNGRRIGRRLNRAYGWELATFAEKE